MTDITIPDAAVEAAARALRFNESSGMCELDRVCALCDCIDPKTSDGYARLHARKALESAAPHIAAQALRDAADQWQINGWAESLPLAGNPVIAMAQHGTDWLRARADRIEADHG